jgi:hypothetical protein
MTDKNKHGLEAQPEEADGVKGVYIRVLLTCIYYFIIFFRRAYYNENVTLLIDLVRLVKILLVNFLVSEKSCNLSGFQLNFFRCCRP